MFRRRTRIEYKFYRDKHPFLRKVRKAGRFLVTIFLGYVVFSHLLVQTFQVDSASMVPTYQPGDRVVASPLLFGVYLPILQWRTPALSRPKRGDVVIIASPYASDSPFLKESWKQVANFFTLQKYGSRGRGTPWLNPLLMKRIIGLPGDIVRLQGSSILVKPKEGNDFVSEFSLSTKKYDIQQEKFLSVNPQAPPYPEPVREVRLGEDEYFVLSDNRVGSLDSRYWGPIHRNQIRSSVLFAYWPFRFHKE